MLFVDKVHKIDREALRTYVLRELGELRERMVQVLHGGKANTFWPQLRDHIATLPVKDKQSLLTVVTQLEHLLLFIDGWINTAVSTEERLDMFIKTKAAEIASGDEHKDYFWAMQIRHDQLVALVTVLRQLAEHLESWISLPPEKVVDHPVFQGLTSFSVEEQVFLEAEKVHEEREKLKARAQI